VVFKYVSYRPKERRNATTRKGYWTEDVRPAAKGLNPLIRSTDRTGRLSLGVRGLPRFKAHVASLSKLQRLPTPVVTFHGRIKDRRVTMLLDSDCLLEEVPQTLPGHVARVYDPPSICQPHCLLISRRPPRLSPGC